MGKKEGKTSADDELDVPPPPPSSMQPDDFGSLDNDLEMPFPGDEMTSGLGRAPEQGKVPDMPSFGDFGADDSFDQPPVQEQKPMPFQEEAPMQMSRQPFAEPRRAARHQHRRGPAYIRLERFSQMMNDLSTARSTLRKTEQVLAEMVSTTSQESRGMVRYKNLLIDVQKKLVFIDKTIFKGEAK